MEEQNTALPAEGAQPAVAGGEAQQAEPTTQETQAEKPEDKPEEKPPEKPPKTPEQREIERLRRGIDRRTRQLAEARALAGLTQKPIEGNNQPQQDDSEHLTLSRADAQRLIEERAGQLAPTIAKQRAEEEQLRAAAVALRKELGDQFEELTDELAEVFTDPRRQFAIAQGENPAALIRYLTDPDNSDEAEALAGMSDLQAGKALAKLELKLAAAKEKPQVSKAPAPLEPVRGSGPVSKFPSDSDPIEIWVRKERERLASTK